MHLENFKDIYNKALNIPVNKRNRNNQAIACIEDFQNKEKDLKKVQILDLPENAIAFTLDKIGIENNLLNKSNVKGINKKCDAVIITEDGDYLYVYLCELKSDNPKPIEYERQLQSSREIINYFIGLYNTFYAQKTKPVYKYILFYRERIKKLKMRPDQMKNFKADILKVSFVQSGTCSYNYNLLK